MPLLLSALLVVFAPVSQRPAMEQHCQHTAAAQDDPIKTEFDKRLKEAEGSVVKLWEVHAWCDAQGREKEGRTVLRAIIKLDDTQRKAHELLGEFEFEGKWFANDKKLEEFKKKRLEEEAKKQGKVVYKGEIVDQADIPMLERGMKKLDGKWVTAEEFKRRSEGWVQHDLDWIPPDEAENIKKGLFKCGDKWLSEADANTYHAELGKWWRLPGDHFVIYATCTREYAKKALAEADRAYREYGRALGKAPEGKVVVLVLNSGEQFNAFASNRQQGVELRGFSSLRGASIAEIWPVPFEDGISTTSGAFCYWDTSTKDKAAFGPFFVRHAAAQALNEALDPSPKTLAALAGGKAVGNAVKEWYDEKQFPEWFRYGSASYVERYIVDQFINAGGDAYWMKKWALQNIANKGGVDPIDDILSMGLTLDDVQKSEKLINEAGLLMSFIIDGKCAPLIDKHSALKDALKRGKDIKAAFKALEDALRKNEAELRKYAGM